MGHRVILCSRDISKGLAAAQNINGQVAVRQLDVTDEKSIRALFQSVKSEFGTLDVLINNAGVGSSEWNSPRESGLKEKIKRDYRGAWKILKLAKPVITRLGLAGKGKQLKRKPGRRAEDHGNQFLRSMAHDPGICPPACGKRRRQDHQHQQRTGGTEQPEGEYPGTVCRKLP